MVIKANIVKKQTVDANLKHGVGGSNSPVQSVNNKTGHVVLDATDVGALPDTTFIPSKVSELENDNGYLTNYTETDPTVPAWAKEPQKPNYTFAEVGADPEGSAVSTVSNHNTNQYSHQDIRLLMDGLTTRLNLLANSDDIDLDQAAEFVAYMKANRTLIESVTTSKVSVSDIIDNLTTNVANKPLSAAQGAILKGLIDATEKKIPTKTSDLTNDSGFLTSDTLNNKGYMTEDRFNLGLYPIVKSVNNIKPDANGNVNVVGGDGTIVYKPTWDDLAQGNTVFVPLEVTSDDVNYGGYHKVSNETPTTEQLRKGGTISFNEGGNGLVTMDYPQEDLAVMERTNGSVIAYNGLVLAVVALEDGMSYMGNTFNKGISFAQNDTVITHSLTVNDYIETTEINPIPVDFLPKSHQFGEITTYVDTLTWDGNTEGLYGLLDMFFNVSPSVPSLEVLQNGGTIAINTRDEEITFTSDHIMDMEALGMGTGCALIMPFEGEPLVGVVYEKGATATMYDITVTFEETGIYFLKNSERNAYTTKLVINGYAEFKTTTKKKLSSDYIDGFVGRTYFYQLQGKLFKDEDCTIAVTVFDVKKAYDKGQIVIPKGAYEYTVTAINFLAYPLQVVLKTSAEDYRVGSAD